jgi:hypothetical protein
MPQGLLGAAMAFPFSLLGWFFHRRRTRVAHAAPDLAEKVAVDMRQATILWVGACVATFVWLVAELVALAW